MRRERLSVSAMLLAFSLFAVAGEGAQSTAAAALQVDDSYTSMSEVAATQELFDVCATNDSAKDVSAAIADGANVHGTLGGGETPLMVCTGSSRQGDVAALLAAGSDPNAQSVDGTTALMLAAKTGQESIVEMLLAAGGNASSADAFGNTPLLVAAMHGRASLIPLLCGAGASPDVMKFNRRSPLMYAANNGDADVARALIQSGADPNLCDAHGLCPLVTAVAAGQAQVMDVLLEAGARVNAQTVGGNVTALHVAAGIGNLHLVRSLIAAGADVLLTTSDEVDAATLVLKGPQPASAERHAIADLLNSMGGGGQQHPRAREVLQAADADDGQEL